MQVAERIVGDEGTEVVISVARLTGTTYVLIYVLILYICVLIYVMILLYMCTHIPHTTVYVSS